MMSMENYESLIRNTVRAVITREQKLLLLRKKDELQGERFALPGGAQDPGETLEQAISRECLEEINTDVEIGDLLHIADFFKQRMKPGPLRHQIEFLFACSVPDSYIPSNGPHPDKSQVEVVWAELNQLAKMPLVPAFYATFLGNIRQQEAPVYLGTIV